MENKENVKGKKDGKKLAKKLNHRKRKIRKKCC